MNNMQYNIQLEKLCAALDLGNIISEPKQIAGGLLHRMYKMQTTVGKYAVKALNPQIMQRPSVKSDIINGERIASYAAAYIPAVYAKHFGNSVITEIDRQNYLIYDWADGNSIFGKDITVEHCTKIGSLLGTLHNIDFTPLNIPLPEPFNETCVNWNEYLRKGEQINLPWTDILARNLKELYDWNRRYLTSMKYLENNFVIGHGDIDPKNIMWNDNKPTVIDWESSGYLNPAHELIIYALYWSDVDGQAVKEKFVAFFKGYLCNRQLDDIDWNTVIDAGLSPHWLEYSLKRSLGMESADAEEQKMGTEQALGTINYLKKYEKSIDLILSWLKNDVL